MPKRFIPLGELARDASDYDSPLLDEAQNVLPIYGVYRPIRQSRIISSFPAPLSSLTPWIEFDGTAAGKVDFASNPWVVTGSDYPFFAISARFRTSIRQSFVLAQCGITDLSAQGINEFGWGVGLDFDFSVMCKLGTTTPPGVTTFVSHGADPFDGEFHTATFISFPPETGLPGVFSTFAAALDNEFSATFVNNPVNPDISWNSLPMKWGQNEAGLEEFQGDIERVMVWAGDAGFEDLGATTVIEDVLAAINIRMDQPLDNVADGSWGPGHLWLLRENAGVTVNDFAETNPLDGTMDAGVTWAGASFGTVANASGITGGIAHFYTAQQASLSRGPVSDISKGEWRSFGGLALPGEEPEEGDFPAGQIFSRMNEAVPDDSQGAILGIPPLGLPNPSRLEVKIDDILDPTVDTGHIVAFRYRFNGKADEESQPFTEMTLSPILLQGSTQITGLTPITVTSADEQWHFVSETIPALDAANITNYADLRIAFDGEIVDGDRQSVRPVDDLQNPDGWEIRHEIATTDVDGVNDFILLYEFDSDSEDLASLSVGVPKLDNGTDLVFRLGIGEDDGVVDTVLQAGITMGQTGGTLNIQPANPVAVGGKFLIFDVTTVAATPRDGTLTLGGTLEGGDPLPLFSPISDHFEMENDDSYVETPGIAAGATTRYRFKLGEADNPRNPNNYNVVTRVQAVSEGVDATFRLLENGREIQRFTQTDIPTTATSYQNEVFSRRANTIQDFSALEMEVVFKAHSDPGGETGGLAPVAIVASENFSGDVEDLKIEDSDRATIGPGGGNVRVSLQSGSDPGTNQNHRIRLVCHRTAGTGDANVQLRQGGVVIWTSPNFNIPVAVDSEVLIDVPPSVVAQISAYQSLGLTLNATGTVLVNQILFQFPGAGSGGRKARLISAIVGLASRAWIGVSWARLIVPDPETRERNDITELYAGNYTQLLRSSPSSLAPGASQLIGEFEDVSKAGGYATSGIPRSWAMTSFGDNVIASNKIDPVQVIAPGDAEFSDLITSAAKPQFAALAVCQNHLVGFNIEYTDAGQGSGPDGRPDEWWCSAFDAPEDFDVSLATGVNRQPIRHPAGEVIAAVGGEFILAFKENSIHRLDYVGSGLLPDGSVRPTFKQDVVSATAGTKFPRSLIQVDRDVYFLDTDGFHVVRNGQYIEDIGVGKVNRMVTDTAFELRAVQPVDTDEIPVADSVCIGAYDQLTGLLWWSIRATGAEGGSPDPIWRNGTFVLYNPKEDRWAVVELINDPATETDDLTATHLWTMPSAAQSSTSFSRGVGILSIDGPYPLDFRYRFRRFLGLSTYESLFRTKIWTSRFIAGGEPGDEILINAIRPSYRVSPEATARPNVRILARTADDPLMQFDVVEDQVFTNQGNEDSWIPLVDIEGEYFQFEMEFPRMFNKTIREIRGIELDFEPAGKF